MHRINNKFLLFCASRSMLIAAITMLLFTYFVFALNMAYTKLSYTNRLFGKKLTILHFGNTIYTTWEKTNKIKRTFRLCFFVRI